MTTVAALGHRPASLDGDYTTSSPLWQWIIGRLEEAYRQSEARTVVSGMALGVDTVAAELALRMNLGLICAIPFKGYDRKWPEPSRRRYAEILAQASQVVYVARGGYDPRKMHQRNEWMVNRAQIVIAVWNGTGDSGTGAAVRYARRQNKPIQRIDPTPMLAA